MFKVEGTTITLSRGDTGAFKVTATGYTFGADDRALFSLKNSQGTVVKQQAYPMTDNQFIVYFLNADTDTLPPGKYTWDIRYVVNPEYDQQGNIVDGDQVATPKTPQPFELLAVVGDI